MCVISDRELLWVGGTTQKAIAGEHLDWCLTFVRESPAGGNWFWMSRPYATSAFRMTAVVAFMEKWLLSRAHLPWANGRESRVSEMKSFQSRRSFSWLKKLLSRRTKTWRHEAIIFHFRARSHSAKLASHAGIIDTQRLPVQLHRRTAGRREDFSVRLCCQKKMSNFQK